MSSRPRPLPLGPEALGGSLASAALVGVAARCLPLRFEFVPNELGIVSATVLARYPSQQEPVWLLLSAGLGGVLLFGIALLCRRRAWGRRSLAAAELLGAALLAALLWTGPWLGSVLVLLGAGAGLLLWTRLPRAQPAAQAAGPAAGVAARRLALWLSVIGIALALRVPRLWIALRHVLEQTPDERLTSSAWVFQAEVGQHLAWVHGLSNGLLHGRDFFCLYGPLFDWIGVGFFAVLGPSVRAWLLYEGIAELLGLLALAALGWTLLRHKLLVVVPLLLASVVNLRLGLPLFGLWLWLRWLRGGGWAGAGAAGLVAGVSLLYSQEFGVAFALASAVVLGVRGSLAGAAAFAAGTGLALAPLLLVYAGAGALAPLLADLAGFPAVMLAGYGNLPFPSPVAALPLGWPLDASDPGLTLRLGCVTAGVCVAAVALALAPRAPLPRAPLAWLCALRAELAADPRRTGVLALGVFGLLAFRSALGRSDPFHVQAVMPPALLLFALFVDRSVTAIRASGAPLALLRLGLLGAVLFAGGVLSHGLGTAAYYASYTARSLGSWVAGESAAPGGDPRVNAAVRYVREQSDPADAVLFLPNNPAFTYLTGRRSPIRFGNSHQIATDVQRAEVLADLQRDPPALLLWDDAALRIDGVPDRLVLGDAVLAWLDAHYEPARAFGPLRVLRRTGDAP